MTASGGIPSAAAGGPAAAAAASLASALPLGSPSMAAAAAVAAVAAGGADGAAAAMQKGLPIITEKSDTQVLPAKSSYLAQDIFFKKNPLFHHFQSIATSDVSAS